MGFGKIKHISLIQLFYDLLIGIFVKCKTNHPPSLGITPQPQGLPPNPRDCPPTLKICVPSLGKTLGSGLITLLSSSSLLSFSVITSKAPTSLSLILCWFPYSEPERFCVIFFAGEAGICGILQNIQTTQSTRLSVVKFRFLVLYLSGLPLQCLRYRHTHLVIEKNPFQILLLLNLNIFYNQEGTGPERICNPLAAQFGKNVNTAMISKIQKYFFIFIFFF